MKPFILPLLIVVLLSGCDHINNLTQAFIKKAQAGSEQTNKTEKKKKLPKRDGLVINKRKDGSILSEITLKDGKLHGPAKDYYVDGTLHAEFTYVAGLLENELKWYHKNGKLYKVSPYLHGKIHGTEKIYNTEGKLIAEQPYNYGFPGIGLKEYSG